jgi:thioredoxin 1
MVFAKLNTEDEPDVAGHFDIRSIPTLMVFRENVILFSQAGALPASGLENVISKIKAVDMEAVHRQIAAEEEKQESSGA